MRTKIYILSSFIILLFFASCTLDDDIFEYPTNNGSGTYSYTSKSVYFSPNGKIETDTINSSGYLNADKGTNSISLNVFPTIGWEFPLSGTNLTTYNNGTENELEAFVIPPQNVYLEGEKYQVVGEILEITDAEGNKINCDGYIKGNTIKFKYRSSDIITGKWVVTETTCINRY